MSARTLGLDKMNGGQLPLSAWCPRCRHQVDLENLRQWPGGVLVIGECPECRAALAASRPLGWSGGANASPSTGVGTAR